MAIKWEKLLTGQAELRIRKLMGGPPTEKLPMDPRSEFERDYDRLVFSTPFRRLQDKAQVFPLDPSDFVRTRLTHSHEVSLIARDLCDEISPWLVPEKHILDDQRSRLTAIAATCALSHDIGNPPFGHAGEQAIAEWFSARRGDPEFKGMDEQHRQDFLRFDGNPQTIRVLSNLKIASDLRGLNMTCGTLSASIKYLPPSHKTDQSHLRRKVGFFASEQKIVEAVRAATAIGDARNPITFIVEAADDIVNCTIDLEDAVKKGMLSWEAIDQALRNDSATSGLAKPLLKQAKKKVEDGPSPPSSADHDAVMASIFGAYARTWFVPAVVKLFKNAHEQIINAKYDDSLLAGSEAGPLVKAIKRLVSENVHAAQSVQKVEVMGRQIIHRLLELFSLARRNAPGSFAGKLYSLMSSNYRNVYEHSVDEEKVPEPYARFRLLTDYICGMTDTFAVRLDRQLTNA
ncbi:MAG TPA: dNTP triphosphohydrolase [Tepidisphaeraceae bacterium]|nr:dNTP triphosphohydrolase [Tepidisphaeraceae bacterium]